MAPFGVRKDALKPFSVVWTSHLLVEIFLLMHPALVPVFRDEFNLSVFQAGLLIAIPSLCRLIIVLPTGIFADRFGPRPFIILSMAVSGLSAMFLSQSANVFVLLVSLSLIMISVTLYHPPGLSVMSRLFPEQAERSTAIGLHGASGCIGQSIGTMSLGLLLPQFGWRFGYLLFSIPLLMWTLALAKARMPQLSQRFDSATKRNVSEEREAQTPIPKKPYVTFGFTVLLLSMGLNALANSGIAVFMTTYLTSSQYLTVEVASIVFGAGPLIGIVGSIAAGYVSARLGDKNSLILIYLGQAVFLTGLIAIPSVPFAVVSFLMYAFFLAAVWTPSTSMVAGLMGKIGGGTAYSLFYFSGDALGAVSPLIAAILIESLNIFAPFVFAIALLSSCALLVRLIRLD
jgi:MFS family permease